MGTEKDVLNRTRFFSSLDVSFQQDIT
jgi:hypothetical protein